MDVIRVRAPSSAHAERLLAALEEGFAASVDGGSPATEVGVRLDSETAEQLVELFDALGVWLTSGGLAAVEIGFGERTYTLLAAPRGKQNDPTEFLLERTIQLQTALDSRVVIEQAKGILAERQQITPEEAFNRLRREARGRRVKLHDLAAEVVASRAEPETGTANS